MVDASLLQDPVALTQALIRCPSITPEDAGITPLLTEWFRALNFTCDAHTFTEENTAPVTNIYASYGTSSPHLCFAGHTDVVPVGNEALWQFSPFAATISEGKLYGRGAVDMKGAIACFIAATSRFITQFPSFEGCISFLITGDEEGPAINGTQKLLHLLHQKGTKFDACIVGEPTNPSFLGEMVKIGRRGSISFDLTIHGTQGHVAYPDIADNPITRLIQILSHLKKHPLDQGNENFPPSNLEITSIDVGNNAGNVIPAQANARFNIRFNTHHTAASLKQWVEECCRLYSNRYSLLSSGIAEAFLTAPGILQDIVVSAVDEVTGYLPNCTTTGGTSDARFIKNYCPVIECGLINHTAHKVDEHISVLELHQLTEIYYVILERYFHQS